MNPELLERCCDRCTHSPDTPCVHFVDCVTAGPLCHEDTRCRERKTVGLKSLKRITIDKPQIYVGTGTCGLGAGAGKTLKAIRQHLKQKRIDADTIEVGCIGLCAMEPIVDIQLPGQARVSFAGVTAENVTGILECLSGGKPPTDFVLAQHRNEELASWDGIQFLDEHPFFAPQTRCVLQNCGLIDPSSMPEYMARGGYAALSNAVSRHTREECCAIIESSGLRGRGGGGFPTGRKWALALNTPSEQKHLICNADEGDPGAFMDRAVIEGDPHRLIEGMAIAAYAIGATTAYVYIRAEYPLAVSRLKQAISDADKIGLLGYNILDSGINLEIILKEGAGAFVCGEETALINSIEGRRGMPKPKPPFPAQEGLFGRPTVINNVETLANVPDIMVKGAEWFRSMGTENSKGTKVFALSGKVKRTGLVEVEMGKTIRDIVFSIGGGIPNNKAYKAVQIGGPSGGCIPEQHVDIQVDYDSLKTVGAMMGSGGLVVMDEDNCMVDVAKFFMEFIQRESCGKCIPCREGTRRMLEILNRLTKSRRNETNLQAMERFKGIMYLERLAKVIKETSLCGLGQTAPNPVLTSLRWFREEYEAHVYERRCPAGACRELVHYRIDPEKCKGCTLCAKKCPTGAIMGAAKSPHYIIEDKCVSCGTCASVCRFDAVIVD